MSARLEGKVALVTGSATGLGAATATRFAEEGATVILSDINGTRVEETAQALRDKGFKAHSLQQDATDEARWDTVVDEIVDQHGKLDVLVNNAGILITGNAEETTFEDWKKTQAINSDAVFLGTRAAIRVMKNNDEAKGSIVNISSIEGLVGEPGAAAYNASKGSVRIFSKSAALHCAGQGYKIRVNTVHPGFIGTELLLGALGDMPEEEAEQAGARLLEAIPMGAMGEPEDIANGCLFLASEESKYMTGSELVIDGGFTAR